MYDSPFEGVLSEANSVTLKYMMRSYEKRYFTDVEPIADLEIENLDGPSCFYPDRRVIRIHPSVANFPKFCGILILHELIHSKLFQRDHDADVAEGERFQAQVGRLWEQGAYAKLL